MAGRPREFDRDEALRRAQAAFWERGYEGTSMSDLVAALGLASSRIYAAFGSKEALFREAVELYEREEGGFADRALAEESTAREALRRTLREAATVYTRPGKPLGCMVVSAATNCSAANDAVLRWLEQHRVKRTKSIIGLVKTAVAQRELRPDTDAQALGDTFATVLHGLSVQARDGVPRKRLLALVDTTMSLFDGQRA
ncbi:TetR/AcrR family transcriptional regulator [Allokutzneria multivorans]|uniref:TetR/AcrR family transcriptional regulator n=1 Tax=Allokutzneria multivorans TaxID=1142134 RepID=A0ABP7SSU1_9PSEU